MNKLTTCKAIVKGVGTKPEYGEISRVYVKAGSTILKGEKVCDIKVQGKGYHRREITLAAPNDLKVIKFNENKKLYKGDSAYEYIPAGADTPNKKSDKGVYHYLLTANSFNGNIAFGKVLAFMHDTNHAEQTRASDGSRTLGALSSIGALGASAVGAGPLAALLSLGRLATASSSNKRVWSLSEIEDIKGVFELTQNSLRSLSRLGVAQGRFISKYKDRTASMWSVFHSTSRGFNLVKLSQAQKCAHCFKDDITNSLLLQALQENNPDLYTSLSNSLYPKEIIPIKGIRLVRQEEAEEKDPNYDIMSGFGEPYRFDFKDDLSFYGYKIPIPAHSDF